MATKKYLDETGLADVAGHVNSRLKTVSTMPVTADLNAVRLYTGEDTQTYKKGHIYQMAATEQNFLQFSADTTTYFMSEDGTITSTAPTSFTPQVEDVPFTDTSTGATLVYMAGNNALVQKLENDVNVITVNFNKIKTSIMPWWTAGAATGSYNPFTIRNVQLVAVTAWVDITPSGGIKTVTVMPEYPSDKDVVIYTGESGMVYEQNHIYQYDSTEDEWIDITAVIPDEEAREVAAGAMALAEEAFETSTKIWKGSEADWDLLPISEKIKYDYVAFDEEDDPITAATVPYDNTDSGLVSTNVQGAIDEVNDKSFNTNDCLMRAKSTGWWNYGESNGLPAGLIRSGYIPKKVVFLGNSFTAHRPVESGDPEGYVWTVYDWRAMAASTPTSDWTSIVYNKLKFINPEVEVKKASIINWEVGTLGSRSLSLCLNDESCAELKDDGGHYLEGVKIADILTPDVDVIIWQGYENMPAPNDTQADFEAFTNDFSNLWTELRAKCPKATIYDYCGWWSNSYKDMCIAASCYKHDVEIIWQWETKLPALITDAKPNLEAQVGYEIYDAEGNVICTVDSKVAGHANDLGHRYIAFYVLDALFNLKTHTKQSLLLGWNTEYVDPSEPGFFDRHYFGSAPYMNANTLSTSDYLTWNDFDGVFIECCIPVIVYSDNIRHALFTCEIDNKRWHYGAGPAVQKINVLASGVYGEIVYNRTWHPDVLYHEQWRDWVVTSAPTWSYSTNDLSTNLSFNGLAMRRGIVQGFDGGQIEFPAFPHGPIFAIMQDVSGGYGPSAAYRANYECAVRIHDATHLYGHTMEIKGDGTVTVDAPIPSLQWTVFGY